jgi:signal transduction histidine kinase
LGLSIVKGIVDAHDGVIFENGKPGKGAKFSILIPYEI